jgi:cyclopropane-fatty-acyl-phospholipid synthase
MRVVLDAILRRLITQGQLTIVWPNGSRSTYQGTEGPSAAVRLRDQRTIRRLVLNPGLGAGEAYMQGGLIAEDGDLYDFLDIMLLNLEANPGRHPFLRFQQQVANISRRLVQYNPAGRARKNVAHHYDLNGRLYSLFLDRDRQYSCGYFPRGDETLEEAQAAKKRHIAAKLCLDRPGLRVLDIGCGWGGMAPTLPASRCPRSNWPKREPEPPPRTCKTGCGSNCRIIARSMTGSIVSFRSACSSMSGWCIIRRSSTPSPAV